VLADVRRERFLIKSMIHPGLAVHVGRPEWDPYMSPPLASVAVSVAVFAGALAGLYLHRLLPDLAWCMDRAVVLRRWVT